MNKLFSNHAFKIIFVVIFMLPIMTRGARRAFQSNNNEVQDWLPPGYKETQDFTWFRHASPKKPSSWLAGKVARLKTSDWNCFARKIVKPEDSEATAPSGPVHQGGNRQAGFRPANKGATER